jgi:crotonobetaine/carnitine-CoA ligase
MTAQTLRDGWVRTGDLGYRDEYGYFHFVDRIKDMLKPSGENVAASEIEDVITSHPGVSECAVLGIPDAVRSETQDLDRQDPQGRAARAASPPHDVTNVL